MPAANFAFARYRNLIRQIMNPTAATSRSSYSGFSCGIRVVSCGGQAFSGESEDYADYGYNKNTAPNGRGAVPQINRLGTTCLYLQRTRAGFFVTAFAVFMLLSLDGTDIYCITSSALTSSRFSASISRSVIAKKSGECVMNVDSISMLQLRHCPCWWAETAPTLTVL